MTDSEAGAFSEIRDRVAVLFREVLDLAAIKLAKLELSAWRGLFAAAGFLLAFCFALAILATAVVFTFAGVAGWIGEATGRGWAGSLIAGIGGIALVSCAFVVARRAARRKVEKRLECRDEN